MDTLAWKSDPGAPFNHGPYPGDTDGDISQESFPLMNLANGKIMYAIVKTVGIDGRESAPSNITEFTPLAQGEFIISADHEAPDGGFDFVNSRSVPGRDPRSDIYLYATSDRIGLSSPSRLGAGLRRTWFQEPLFGKPEAETIRIGAGDRFMVKLKTGSARIRIESILGQYPDVSAKISYVYYPVSN